VCAHSEKVLKKPKHICSIFGAYSEEGLALSRADTQRERLAHNCLLWCGEGRKGKEEYYSKLSRHSRHTVVDGMYSSRTKKELCIMVLKRFDVKNTK
jgi:hypothetical protein